MAGKTVVNKVQLGDSATATNNFVLQTNVDGTMKLARGNDGATTQDVIKVNADGGSRGIQPAFGVYQSVAQSALASSTWTKISFQTEEFDTDNAFDSVTNFRFQPQIAGYYQINGAVQYNGTSSGFTISIYKNGSIYKTGQYIQLSVAQPTVSVSTIVFLNGTTDYIELYGWTATSLSLQPVASSTYLNGALVRAA